MQQCSSNYYYFFMQSTKYYTEAGVKRKFIKKLSCSKRKTLPIAIKVVCQTATVWCVHNLVIYKMQWSLLLRQR